MDYVGQAGDANNSYVVNPRIEKTIEALSARRSILQSFMRDAKGAEQKVKTIDLGEKEVDIGNSQLVWLKDFKKGDESRITLGLDLDGMPTHGSHPVRQGNYLDFMHDYITLNAFRSPEFPLFDEMSQQRFANFIENLDSYQQVKIAEYMGRWVDFLGIQAIFNGGDRGLLLTEDGGLGKKLLNAASAGDPISNMNTYVAGTGFVPWNDTRSTFEGSIGSAIYGLTDTTDHGFSLEEHNKHLNYITSVKRYPTVKFMGKELRAVALADPWLIKRILNRSGSWMTLLKDADVRGPQNHAIDRDQSVIIDKILYIPVDWMRAFRAYGPDAAQPTYGVGLKGDPVSYIKTADSASKKCGIAYLSAGALLAGRGSKWYMDASGKKKNKGRIWFTGAFDKHATSGGWAAHMKIGFKRCEWFKDDGSSEYLNNKSHVAWYYDPGPGVSFAA